MPSYWRAINEVLVDADVLIEVLDSRFPELSRNSELEYKIEKAGKPLIYVINKCDLIPKELAKKYSKKLSGSIFVSSKHRYGTQLLRTRIMQLAPNRNRVIVGVLGYPNTGKSSLINALKGGSPAKTSSTSGFTKGKQNVRVSKKIKVIDTPGVLPFREKDVIKHTLIGALSPEQVDEPDLPVFALIKHFPGVVEKYYGVTGKDPEQVLTAIAQKKNRVLKEGEPDITTTAKLILQDWQKGKIPLAPQSI